MSATRSRGHWLLAVVCAAAAAASGARKELRPARAEERPQPAMSARVPAGAAAGSASPTAGDGTAPAEATVEAPPHLRPPGAAPADGGPSVVIFPEQRLPLRFDHEKHVKGLGLGCATCHERARTSGRSEDVLLPSPAVCDRCHGTSHDDRSTVLRDEAKPLSECAVCHAGHRPEDGNRVERVVIPRPNLRFSHAAHAARNIGCQQCHGAVQDVGLATRDQLPRMRGCLRCHGMEGPGRGDARGECPTCHLTEEDGRLRTRYPSGTLLPPAWLRASEHGPDWLIRHRAVAAADSEFCSTCHTERECVDCHDGRVRPRSFHPNDWLSLHAVAARQDGPSCGSCHRAQTFCLTCHQRAGVTASGPLTRIAGRGRFHPPRAVWTDSPRGGGHHAFEAQRNMDACVSCHTERECVACHAARGTGSAGPPGSGLGISPHPPDFPMRCRTALRKNPRPCMVCHDPGDARLAACR